MFVYRGLFFFLPNTVSSFSVLLISFGVRYLDDIYTNIILPEKNINLFLLIT